MDIYVQSRGFSQDYRWLKITEKGQYCEEPCIPNQFTELIDTDAESIVLGRFKNKLVLLATGLETSQRTDNHHRKIRNSVAWISQNSDDEAVIQALTVLALQDELSTTIDNAVKFGSEQGFEVSWSMLPKLTPPGIDGKSSPPSEEKFGNLSKRKEQLANEIAKLEYLPGRDKDSLLVVVTGVSAKKDLKNAGVWWGLSSRINLEEEEGWQEVSNLKNSEATDLNNSHHQDLIMTVLLFALAISLSINLWLTQQFLLPSILQEQNQNINFENQELQNKSKKISFENQKLDADNKLKLKQAD